MAKEKQPPPPKIELTAYVSLWFDGKNEIEDTLGNFKSYFEALETKYGSEVPMSISCADEFDSICVEMKIRREETDTEYKARMKSLRKVEIEKKKEIALYKRLHKKYGPKSK